MDINSDINSLVSKYLSNHEEADINKIGSAIKNLRIYAGEKERDSERTSVFNFDGDNTSVSRTEFIEIMCNATGKSSDEIQDDVSILFDILNYEDENKEFLSKQELSIFDDVQSDVDISSFRVWDILYGYDEKEINQYLTQENNEAVSGQTEDSDNQSDSSVSGSSASGSSTTGSSTTGSSSEVSETQTNASEETGTSEEAGASEEAGQQSGSVNISSNYDFSDKNQAKAFVSQYIGGNLDTPKKVIDWLIDINAISEEDAELLRNAYNSSYTSEEQAKIDGLMALGKTEEEAVEELKNQGMIGEQESQLEQEVKNPNVTLSDADAQIYASQLHDSMSGFGTDEDQFDSIFNDANFTSSDMVKIISVYNQQYGSFIKDIDDDFSGSTQNSIQERYADLLIDAAENGDDSAIQLLCLEFYNGTAGQWLTANEFIDRIFEKGSDETLAKLARNYKSVTGSDIFNDIKGDFSFGTEDEYIRKLNKALSNVKDS